MNNIKSIKTIKKYFWNSNGQEICFDYNWFETRNRFEKYLKDNTDFMVNCPFQKDDEDETFFKETGLRLESLTQIHADNTYNAGFRLPDTVYTVVADDERENVYIGFSLHKGLDIRIGYYDTYWVKVDDEDEFPLRIDYLIGGMITYNIEFEDGSTITIDRQGAFDYADWEIDSCREAKGMSQKFIDSLPKDNYEIESYLDDLFCDINNPEIVLQNSK